MILTTSTPQVVSILNSGLSIEVKLSLSSNLTRRLSLIEQNTMTSNVQYIRRHVRINLLKSKRVIKIDRKK